MQPAGVIMRGSMAAPSCKLILTGDRTACHSYLDKGISVLYKSKAKEDAARKALESLEPGTPVSQPGASVEEEEEGLHPMPEIEFH